MKNPTSKALYASLLVLLGWFASRNALAQICTREYAPVCGQTAGDAPRTLANRCLLDAANATLMSQGECKAMPMVGNDVGTHGCKGSSGFRWNDELKQCVRPWMSSAITLEVAPQRQTCIGLTEMPCLMVREIEPGGTPKRWEPLFGIIAGFKHLPGKTSTLRVRKDKIDMPPADASNISYTLLKFLP